MRYLVKPDSTKQEITLTARFDPTLVHSRHGCARDSEHLVLTGVVNGDSLVVRLRRVDEQKYLLVTRGFRWIQELPVQSMNRVRCSGVGMGQLVVASEQPVSPLREQVIPPVAHRPRDDGERAR